MGSGNENDSVASTSAPAMPAAAGALATPAPPLAAGAAIETVHPNIGMAVIAGLIASLSGAALWAVVTVSTKMQIGFMAIGVGLLVAWAVRKFGQGQSAVFGVLGGAFALFGCLLGNLLSTCAFLSIEESQPLAPIITKVLLTPALAAQFLQATFDGMDLLFYAIAVYEGYKFARRPASA